MAFFRFGKAQAPRARYFPERGSKRVCWICRLARNAVTHLWRHTMAKGQLRGNRETKKPKQPKKPVAPAAPFGAVQSRVGNDGTAGKKK
ncbi:hypothetical protein CS8_001940 [Cupriavidus sp. 8B]